MEAKLAQNAKVIDDLKRTTVRTGESREFLKIRGDGTSKLFGKRSRNRTSGER